VVVVGTVNGAATRATAIGGIIGDGQRVGRTETAYGRRAGMIIHKQIIVTVVIVAVVIVAVVVTVFSVVGTCAVLRFREVVVEKRPNRKLPLALPYD